MRSLLEGLPESRIPVALRTSKVREVTVAGRRGGAVVGLDELGIDGHFVHAIGAEDATHSKPHPNGMERLLVHMGTHPKRTLVVVDS